MTHLSLNQPPVFFPELDCCAVIIDKYSREWSGSLVPRLSNCPDWIIEKRSGILHPVNEGDEGGEGSPIKRMNFKLIVI